MAAKEGVLVPNQQGAAAKENNMKNAKCRARALARLNVWAATWHKAVVTQNRYQG